jgi:hypothetical protein
VATLESAASRAPEYPNVGVWVEMQNRQMINRIRALPAVRHTGGLEMRDTGAKMFKDRRINIQVTIFGRGWFAKYTLVINILLLVIFSPPLKAQERVRTSAGKLEIQSFRNPEVFFRIGPILEAITGTAGFSYSDNSQLSNTDKISRFSIYQSLDLDTTWILSHFNRLELKVAGKLSEDFFGNGKDKVVFGIAPDSKVQFQFAISDFRVRLYDQFSYVQDPTSDPTVTNTTYLNRLTNSVGAAIDKDLRLAVLTLSADYTYSNESGTNVQNQTTSSGTRHTFRLGSDITFQSSHSIQYGLSTSVSRSIGSGPDSGGNVNSLSTGPFIRGKLSKFTDFDLAAGINLIDATPSIPLTYYVSGVIRHQIQRHWQAIFSATRDFIFTTGTALSEETVFRLETRLDVTRRITFTASGFFTFGDENSGVTPGSFRQYGLALDLVWTPRKRWSTGVSYDLTRREGSGTSSSTTSSTTTSTTASTSYLENLVTFKLSYLF